MSFIDSYKHLEKLCGEALNDDRRISAYIDEMLNIPNGPFYVKIWEEDLKKLKHYRWIRNQISHEPGCTEENMCEPEDELWLKNFYSRIMNQTDPLALYRKARMPRINATPVTRRTPTPNAPLYIPSKKRHRRSSKTPVAFLIVFIILLLIIEMFLLMSNNTYF